MKMLDEVRKNWKSILVEKFEDYDEGPFSEGYSAVSEFHYPPKKIFQGPWQEISSYHLWGEAFNSDFPNWKIIRANGKKVLKQTLDNRPSRKYWKHVIKKLFFRSRLPLIVAFPALSLGDPLWMDYCLIAKIQPLANEDLVGVLFRMINAQNHYIFGLKRDGVHLLRRCGDNLQPIEFKNFRYVSERDYVISVLVHKNQIQCFVDNELVIDEQDERFQTGKVGLIANVPAIFSSVEVYMEQKAVKDHIIKKEELTKKNCKIRDEYPEMKLCKRIDISNLCSGRTIRFGDLTGDGTPDLLIAQGKPMVPGNNYNMITALSAMDFNGNILWQRGETSVERYCNCSDLAFQIYDIDDDGYNEVICASGFHIEVLDGRNGEVKLRIPTPESVPPHSKFQRIIGDAIYICNLSGKDRPQDILLKDRYSKTWAFDNKLNLLWEYRSKREMGHFPYAMDINNDGKDEIMVGYSLLRADGQKLWELPLRDHADAVAIIRSVESNEYQIIIAASDEGLIFADIRGRIKKQLRLGHVQTITVARLIPDSSNFQLATNTYWGNPGIIYLLDLDGNLINSFQPSIYGSPLCPVHWTGNGEEFLLLSAAADETGGLYDSYGNQVVAFPDDGHPTLCYDAFDLNGDGLDELICWDHDSLWVYARDSKLENKSLWKPRRLPAPYNASNYRSNISI